MPDFTDNFRVSNAEGWYDTYSLMQGAGLVSPWAGLPAWQRGATYTTGSAITFDGDLYISRPRVPSVTWTSALTFGADIDEDGLSRWTQVGSGDAFAQTPVDLTGAAIRFAIWPADASGNLLGEYPALTASTPDEVQIINAAGGGYALAVSADRTRSVTPGTYRYDFTADFADGTRGRIRYGLWYVDQGIA